MSSLECTSFHELKLRGKQFFELAQDANEDELEGLMDAFNHSFLACDYPEDTRGEIDRTINAPALLSIVAREYFKLKEKFL